MVCYCIYIFRHIWSIAATVRIIAPNLAHLFCSKMARSTYPGSETQVHCSKSDSEHSPCPSCHGRDFGARNRAFQRWGGGGDTTIPSPGRSPKQPLPGIGLHDTLHDRQACPEFNCFHQRFGQISPQEGLFSCRPLPKRGRICDIPAPLPNR